MTKHFKIHPTEELFEDYIKEENTIGYPRVDYIEEDKKIWRSRITPKIDHSREYLTFRTVNGARWESLLFFIPSEISTDYVRSISYSIDNGESWITTNNVDEESIRVEINSAPLGKVLIKGDADQYGVYFEEDEYTIWCSFGSEQLFNVSGNIMSLFYGDNFIGKTQFPEESSYNCYYLFSWDYENWEYTCNIKHASGLVLPSMELTECCYEEMFYECTSLVDVPELPATTLAIYCYSSMFSNCTSLTSAPELPSTTLAESCYSGMFSNCTSLTSTPELPATTLANWCYSSMFSSCISLTTAPDLPATELKEQCYSSMFYGCSSLEIAPELPATTLADYCYSYMFQECTSLNYIKALFIELPSTKYTNRWVQGVNKRGIFVQNGSASWWLMGHNGIPNPDWTLQYEGESTTAENAKASALGEALTMEIESKMSITIIIPPQIQKYQLDWIAYSVDNGDTWNTVQNTNNRSDNIYFGTTKAVEPGKKVIWLGSGITLGSSYSSSDLNCRFESTWSSGRFKIKGNLVSLLGSSKSIKSENYSSSCTFSFLFTACSQLTDASELILPSYVSYGCYSRMFSGCTSLTKAPELPATTLAGNCYPGMFQGCTSLISAPKLPATTLTYGCYYQMFNNCTSLKYINMQATDISASYCLGSWVQNVSSAGTFIKNSLSTWDVSGVNGIPSEWTVANEIKYLESTGTQYIETISTVDSNNVILKAKYQFTESRTDSAIWGAMTSNNSCWLAEQYGNTWWFGSTGSKFSNSQGTNLHEVTWVMNNGTVSGSVDNVDYSSTYNGTVVSHTPIHLFCTKQGSSVIRKSSARLYNYSIKDDGLEILDLIPVRVGQVGYMCNKINGELYGNSGTGDFILGDDI